MNAQCKRINFKFMKFQFKINLISQGGENRRRQF